MILSRYFDYSTTKNIMVTVGLTNPTTASITFYMKLYSYYYSASRYSLTISTSNTYITDVTYTSFTKVSKSIVSMYPFHSRISSIPNAPIRIRFKIPTSTTISYGTGKFVFTYSQIQYSSSHLCYIIMYASYAAMMQQT